MATTLILGAGVSGHTAAMRLRRALGRGHDHEVVVVSPNAEWNWIPSNIWVGVGQMPAEKVVFELAPIYRRAGVTFHQARGLELHPGGEGDDPRPFAVVESTVPGREGERTRIHYDYLVNATGPRLDFGRTPGLGPGRNSLSVCTPDHAVEAAEALERSIRRMESGEELTLVVGMGHGTCTCEGAAFEYVFNVEHELRRRGVRERATVVYLSNEAELGDFGVGGMVFRQQGFETTSELWTASIFRERGVRAILGAHVERVDEGSLTYELLDGTKHQLAFDFAMLLPPFTGVGLRVLDPAGEDVSASMFAPNGFMKVDANYAAGAHDRWSADDWPSTYESPTHPNHFAVGIAFAPPHGISRPRTSASGTPIAPAPPRTGMPSGIMGKTVAETIADRIRHGAGRPARTASMARMAAACIASAGTGMRKGTAAAMTMFPVVPDRARYPGSGRDPRQTRGEIGLGAHWTKLMLHHMFIYKAKARPLWWLMPE